MAGRPLCKAIGHSLGIPTFEVNVWRAMSTFLSSFASSSRSCLSRAPMLSSWWSSTFRASSMRVPEITNRCLKVSAGPSTTGWSAIWAIGATLQLIVSTCSQPPRSLTALVIGLRNIGGVHVPCGCLCGLCTPW